MTEVPRGFSQCLQADVGVQSSISPPAFLSNLLFTLLIDIMSSGQAAP
jgi:hypothetical protein